MNLGLNWDDNNNGITGVQAKKRITNYIKPIGDVEVFTYNGSPDVFGRELEELIVTKDMVANNTKLLFEFAYADYEVGDELMGIFDKYKDILSQIKCYFLNVSPIDYDLMDLMNRVYEHTGITIGIAVTDIGLFDYLYGDRSNELMAAIGCVRDYDYNCKVAAMVDNYDFFVAVKCLIAGFDGVFVKNSAKIPAQHYTKFIRILVRHGRYKGEIV